MSDYDFRVISLGAGVQSTALVIASVLGIGGIPSAECAIFADTQDEPPWVYDNLARLQQWVGNRLPIHRVTIGRLSEHLGQGTATGRRYASIPAFTQSHGVGMLRRQCTREYKIEPIQQKIRQLLGYQKGQRVRHRVAVLLGISLDEASRMKPSRVRWITNVYPLIDARLTRSDCRDMIQSVGLPIPKKSACVFCPYHSDRYWLDLRTNYPDEWNKAVKVDEWIRNSTKGGVLRPVYLHRRCIPLKEVPFQGENQPELFDAICDEGYCGL